MIRYVKMTNNLHKNTVIKVEDRSKHYRYIFGADKWVSTVILAKYFIENARNGFFDMFDKYEEISEQEAMTILEDQKIQYKRLYDKMLEKAEENMLNKSELLTYICEKDGFQDTETDIVALIYCFGEKFYSSLDCSDFPFRILNSVDILFNKSNLGNEIDLSFLRGDVNTRPITKFIIEEQYTNKKMNKDQYQVLMDYFNGKIQQLSDQNKRQLNLRWRKRLILKNV